MTESVTFRGKYQGCELQVAPRTRFSESRMGQRILMRGVSTLTLRILRATPTHPASARTPLRISSPPVQSVASSPLLPAQGRGQNLSAPSLLAHPSAPRHRTRSAAMASARASEATAGYANVLSAATSPGQQRRCVFQENVGSGLLSEPWSLRRIPYSVRYRVHSAVPVAIHPAQRSSSVVLGTKKASSPEKDH